MADFITTTAISHELEQLIKNAREKIILISPYLKLNRRLKELLEDKDRLKIDIRIVYGKVDLQPDEMEWLKDLTYVRTSFCRDLHAKCYISETKCIITSLNLYEFSQVNNYEMGVVMDRELDTTLYSDAHEEAQRIIRASEEVKMHLEKVTTQVEEEENKSTEPASELLSTSKLAKKLGLSTQEFTKKLLSSGLLTELDGGYTLTTKGSKAGGEFVEKSRFGPYFRWPTNLDI